ncbi:MAG: hypothetical protein V1702_05780 [Candidatus Woesearchaeota archaeon]
MAVAIAAPEEKNVFSVLEDIVRALEPFYKGKGKLVFDHKPSYDLWLGFSELPSYVIKHVRRQKILRWTIRETSRLILAIYDRTSQETPHKKDSYDVKYGENRDLVKPIADDCAAKLGIHLEEYR